MNTLFDKFVRTLTKKASKLIVKNKYIRIDNLKKSPLVDVEINKVIRAFDIALSAGSNRITFYLPYVKEIQDYIIEQAVAGWIQVIQLGYNGQNVVVDFRELDYPNY